MKLKNSIKELHISGKKKKKPSCCLTKKFYSQSQSQNIMKKRNIYPHCLRTVYYAKGCYKETKYNNLDWQQDDLPGKM